MVCQRTSTKARRAIDHRLHDRLRALLIAVRLVAESVRDSSRAVPGHDDPLMSFAPSAASPSFPHPYPRRRRRPLRLGAAPASAPGPIKLPGRPGTPARHPPPVPPPRLGPVVVAPHGGKRP